MNVLSCTEEHSSAIKTVQRLKGYNPPPPNGRCLNAMEKWCEKWKININDVKTRAVYFSKRLRRAESCLTLKGQNIEFVNNVKYLGVTLDKRMTWKAHIEWSVTKALQTF
jgi:hypothetical protein